MRSAAIRTALLVGAASLASACHTYRTVDVPPVGSTARVRLPVVFAPEVSVVADTVSIHGTVLSPSTAVLALATRTRRPLGPYTDLVRYDTLHLRDAQVSSVEVKELSGRRSLTLGVALAVGTLVAVLSRSGVRAPSPADLPGESAAEVFLDQSLWSSLLRLASR